jgi:uncharacterized protein
MSAELATWGCARHAQLGKTCCQTCEVFVTAGDRRRIEESLRASGSTVPAAFWEYRAPADARYLDQEHDPSWLRFAFRSDLTRPVLRRLPAGDCLFLGESGCCLPLFVRPLVCRLYPYTYTEQSIDGVSDECPREVVPPGSTILQVLDMRREEADVWHRQLYEELRAGSALEEPSR